MSGLELFIYALAAILYFVPTYIALGKKMQGWWIIFGMNFLFAWTFIAWVLLIIAAISVDDGRNLVS